MELLFNELSLHEQFADLSDFRRAIGGVMRIRGVARQYGVPLQCHRNTVSREIRGGQTLVAAAARLGRDEGRVVMQWLTKAGPFWNDERRHGADEYLQCRGELVTDFAIGESAWRAFHDIPCAVVSVDPSGWVCSPLTVEWILAEQPTKRVEVGNYWTTEALRAAIEEAPAAIGSWKELQQAARARCPDLTFARDAFGPLQGCPFNPGAAERLLLRLRTLQRLKNGFDAQGRRTAEANSLYAKEFRGAKGLFSDSSASEKQRFRHRLRFPHPAKSGESLFCPWHGKVKTPQLRVHFSWPIAADGPLFVVHVGPKITKR